MKCDLHTHSIYSDGSCTVSEIVSQAKHLGLIVALTDHNTVAGLPEFMKEAESNGVTAVPGIEFSTVYNDTELHLLGLFIAPQYYDRLEAIADKFHKLKEQSNIELARRLNEAGFAIDYDSVKKRNPTGNINRAHFAAELLEIGLVDSISAAFETILSEDYGFYVPPERLQLLDAIKTLRSIKALPILAHPLQELDEDNLRAMLPEAIEAGLVGIETQHSFYDLEKIETAARIAKEFNILQSGGSDFHGTNKKDIYLGVGKGNLSIPIDFYDDLLRFQQSL